MSLSQGSHCHSSANAHSRTGGGLDHHSGELVSQRLRYSIAVRLGRFRAGAVERTVEELVQVRPADPRVGYLDAI